MIYAALPGRSTDQLKSSKEVVIDDQTIKLDFVSTNTNQVIEQFISKTKNQKEVTVLSSTFTNISGLEPITSKSSKLKKNI